MFERPMWATEGARKDCVYEQETQWLFAEKLFYASKKAKLALIQQYKHFPLTTKGFVHKL